MRNLAVAPGDRSVKLTYQIPTGVDHVVITRSRDGGTEQVVYNGQATTYIDRGLANGTEYHYVVASVDSAGNKSAGVAILAMPKRNLLRSPKDGARLKKTPKLAWFRNAEADYYNVQLYRGDVKILSAWPTQTSFTLPKSWKFQGRKYSLTPGPYTWYIWPGYGARSAVHYGELLGFRSFRIVR